MTAEIIIIVVIGSILLLKFIVYLLNKHTTQEETIHP